MFSGYLRVVNRCAHCDEPFGHIRADDIPPYITILIVGHIIVPLLLVVYQNYRLELWVSMLIWPPLTLALTLILLPLVKGATVGALWALRLRGDERQ